jgi:hypothetical protein
MAHGKVPLEEEPLVAGIEGSRVDVLAGPGLAVARRALAALGSGPLYIRCIGVGVLCSGCPTSDPGGHLRQLPAGISSGQGPGGYRESQGTAAGSLSVDVLIRRQDGPGRPGLAGP